MFLGCFDSEYNKKFEYRCGDNGFSTLCSDHFHISCASDLWLFFYVLWSFSSSEVKSFCAIIVKIKFFIERTVFFSPVKKHDFNPQPQLQLWLPFLCQKLLSQGPFSVDTFHLKKKCLSAPNNRKKKNDDSIFNFIGWWWGSFLTKHGHVCVTIF